MKKRKKPGRRPKYRRPYQRLDDELEKLHGAWVRQSGVCFASGELDLECKAPLQYCHIYGRRETPIFKRSPLNAVCMCAAHHSKYTNQCPTKWGEFIERMMPGRLTFLNDLDLWYQRNGAIVDRKEVNEFYKRFYEARIEDKKPLLFKDSWLEWHLGEEEYDDFVAKAHRTMEGQ